MRNFIQLLLLIAFGTLSAQVDTVTFKVDMNDYTGSFTTVNVNGSFNGWCGACNAMADPDMDGVWEVKLPISSDTIEYKFTLDGWTAQENFNPGDPCTVTNFGFTNRSLIFTGDTVLGVVCYNSCSACTGVTLSQVDLPITWDDTTVAYTTGSFGGVVESIVTDPTDATNTVLKQDKPTGAQTWGGTTISTGGLATAIPFTTGGANTISVRFWSPDAGAVVLLKVEDKSNAAIFVETTDTTTVANGWQVLTFDFNNPRPNAQAINTANTYDLISIFPNFGVDGATAGAKTYYVDQVVYGTISVSTGMSGVYTINSTLPASATNYTSFSAAAADLTSLGVVGACTFNVAAGSYTDTVYLPAITGTSMTNTITFDGGDSATTTLSYNSAAVNQKAVILMDGADYVSFKNLTIAHSGTTDSWGIRMQNDNDNFSVDACRFEMASVASTSADVTAIGSSGSATSSFTETEAGDNISITNSAFIDGQYGVHFEVLAYGDTNCVIDGNIFLRNYYRNYMSDNAFDVTFSNNTISGMAYSFGYAVAFYDIVDFDITGNNINCPDWGIYVSDGNFDGTPLATSTIANNMIISANDEAIYCDDFESTNVYYNSFVVSGSTSTSAYGGYFNDCKTVEIKNNVFYSESSYAVYFSDNTTLTGTSSDPIVLDNNAYHTVSGANLAYDAGIQADLASWQTARVGNNAASVSGDPIFNGASTDLHVSGPLLNGAATPIASITTDIDGDARDATTPDIGADEYTPASCLPASALAASMTYADSARVVWFDNNTSGGTTFTLEYGALGFTPGTGTTVTAITDTFYTITGLTGSTDYDFYITADCGAGGTASQVGPGTFRTACAVYTAPYLESFTGIALGHQAEYSNCWTNPSSLTPRWEAEDATGANENSSTTGPFYDATTPTTSGGYYMYLETSSGSTGASSELVSPAIDHSSLTTPELAFYYHMYGATINKLLIYAEDLNGNRTVLDSIVGQQMTAGSDPFARYAIDLSGLSGSVYKYIFEGYRGSSFTGDISIDEVSVDNAPACSMPLNLSTFNATASSIDVRWDDNGASNGYHVIYGTAGFDPSTGGTTMASANDTITISGLMSATAYDFYVYADCGSGSLSDTAGPSAANTACPASFAAPYSTDFENISLGTNASYENCWTTNPGSSAPRWDAEDAAGFNENSSGTGPLVDNTVGVGGTYFFLETSGATAGDTNVLYSPSIDISTLTAPMVRYYYHMHGAAMGTLRLIAEDASGNRTVIDSLVGQQQAAQADAWVERLVLPTLASGTYRFLFEGVAGTSFTSDMSIDDFAVVEAPSCFPSSGLSVVSSDDVSATVTWTAGTGTSWDIEYGPAGFTPGTGTVVNTTSNPYTITGLTAATAYDFYVTDSCGSGGVAQTAGPASFTTSACPTSDQCVFRADLSDSFGDGWNGGAISVYQAGVLVGKLGTGFTSGSSFTDSITLCDGLPTVVTLDPAGSWPSEIGLVLLNPKGDTAGVHIASGSVGTGDTLFSFNASCTRCLPFTAPFYESFETSSPSVDCWSNVYIADTRDWTIGTGSSGGAITSAYAGSQNAVFVSASGGPDTTLFVSPRIDLSAMISPQLSFWYAQEEWFGDQNITNVYYRASETDPWTFLFGDNQNRNSWTQAIVSLPNGSSTYQIAIMGINNWGRANVVDSLAITDAANICGKPDSVQASNVTATSADISWVSGTNQSSSWIEYGPAGFAPGTGTVVNPATSATTLSGLMPGTLYEACVYDICSTLGDTSDAECVSFATLCAPITNYPYMEDFDNGVIPPCYSETSTATGYTWRVDNGGTPSSATGPAVDHTTGTATGYYMYVEASSPAAQGDSAFLWTAEFDLTSLTNPEVVYYYHMYGSDIVNLDLQAFDRTTSAWVSINNIVGQQQTSNAAAWGEARVSLATYGTDTALQLRLLSVRGASFNGDAAVDDIMVRETPPCVDPANLAVVTATSSSVTLSWDSDTNIVASTVQYGAPGFALGTGTNVAATAGGFTVTGLAGTTCYDFYVQDSCSAATNWIGPVTACTIATCSVSTTPSSTTNDTTDCDGGSTTLSATSSTSNDLVWLNNGQAVNTGAVYVTDSVAFTTPFDVAEFVTTNSVSIGPLTNIATSGYGNFSNGQWITVNDTVHIDSMTVNHTNDVTAQVIIWDASITNVIQLGDTFTTAAGVTGDARVTVNMVLTPGVYFMNLNFISGAGALFRATGGAAYPYTVAGLMSIDSTNFADQSRIYYTFDMSISKACIGPATQAFAVVPGANAGMTDTVTVCSTNSAVNLASFLGVYDTGGTWVDVDGTSALTDSIFDATAVTAGAAYNFSYIVAGVSGCPGDTAHLNVNVEAAPDAGIDTTALACQGSGILILRNYITGNKFGGTWVDLDGSGALGATGSFNTNNATAGVYRAAYILSGTVCDPDTAIVTVDLDDPVSAGVAVSDTACDDETMVDLNTYLDASASAGGTWTDLSGTGALSGNIFDATAVASGASYDFQYKVTSNCGDDSIVVSLLVDDCGVGLNELSTGFISIYPNPTKGIINIDDDQVEGNIQVELYSASGALVMSQIYTEHEEIRLDITDYAVGIYTVKVSSSKGLDVKRIMKN